MHFSAMSRNLERMRAALTEWMIKEEILGDAFFVNIEAWRDRNEPYGNDSLLVLVFDSSTLHTMLNYGGDTMEFDDLVESFGFWYELGHSWNMGFYPIEGYDYSRLSGTYASKLQDEKVAQEGSHREEAGRTSMSGLRSREAFGRPPLLLRKYARRLRALGIPTQCPACFVPRVPHPAREIRDPTTCVCCVPDERRT